MLAFDSIADSPYCYKMDFDFYRDGVMRVDYVAKSLNGKGNVIQILGVSGSAPAIQMNQGQNDELKKFPGLKVVAKVEGEASASVAQQNTANVLPRPATGRPRCSRKPGMTRTALSRHSRPRVGPCRLFLEMALRSSSSGGCNRKKNKNYETVSIGSAPGIGGAAFWVGLAILNKLDVPMKMQLPLSVVTQDDVEKYSNLKPGMTVSPDFTYQYVLDNVINKK